MTNRKLLSFRQACYRFHKDTMKPTTRLSVVNQGRSLVMHRHPKWMPLTVHICLETVLVRMLNFVDKRRTLRKSKLSLPYHVLHGLICDYEMADIVDYIKHIDDDNYYINKLMTGD